MRVEEKSTYSRIHPVGGMADSTSSFMAASLAAKGFSPPSMIWMVFQASPAGDRTPQLLGQSNPSCRIFAQEMGPEASRAWRIFLSVTLASYPLCGLESRWISPGDPLNPARLEIMAYQSGSGRSSAFSSQWRMNRHCMTRWSSSFLISRDLNVRLSAASAGPTRNSDSSDRSASLSWCSTRETFGGGVYL